MQRLPRGLRRAGRIAAAHQGADLIVDALHGRHRAGLAEQSGHRGTADSAQTGTGRGVGQQADQRGADRRGRAAAQRRGEVSADPLADRRLHVGVRGQPGDQRADRAAECLRHAGIGQHRVPCVVTEQRVGVEALKPGLQCRSLVPAGDHRQDELFGGREDRRLGVGLAEQISQRRIGDRHRLTGGHRGGRGGQACGAGEFAATDRQRRPREGRGDGGQRIAVSAQPGERVDADARHRAAGRGSQHDRRRRGRCRCGGCGDDLLCIDGGRTREIGVHRRG